MKLPNTSGRRAGTLGRAHVPRDQVAHCLRVASAQTLDRVGPRVDDVFEEALAVLVGRQRVARPATDLVEHLGELRVWLAVALGDLAAQALGERRAGAPRGDCDRDR